MSFLSCTPSRIASRIASQIVAPFVRAVGSNTLKRTMSDRQPHQVQRKLGDCGLVNAEGSWSGSTDTTVQVNGHNRRAPQATARQYSVKHMQAVVDAARVAKSRKDGYRFGYGGVQQVSDMASIGHGLQQVSGKTAILRAAVDAARANELKEAVEGVNVLQRDLLAWSYSRRPGGGHAVPDEEERAAAAAAPNGNPATPVQHGPLASIKSVKPPDSTGFGARLLLKRAATAPTTRTTDETRLENSPG